MRLQSMPSRSATRLQAPESSRGAGSLAVWRVLARRGRARRALAASWSRPPRPMTRGRGCCGAARSRAAALDTREGPAFKPLPVACPRCSLRSADAAPVVWVLLVRGRGALALRFAARLGRRRRRLAVGGRAGAAVAGVRCAGASSAYTPRPARSPRWCSRSRSAASRPGAGRTGLALACAVGCGLLRVEAWPFLLAGGAVAVARGRERPRCSRPRRRRPRRLAPARAGSARATSCAPARARRPEPRASRRSPPSRPRGRSARPPRCPCAAVARRRRARRRCGRDRARRGALLALAGAAWRGC